MKRSINRSRIKLYLWMGAAYLLFWMFIDLVSTPETFFKRVINNIWLVSYLTVLNFILFEFTFPFIRPTWKRVVLTPFLLWAHVMSYSFGLYAWRYIGIQLHIYTALRIHPSVEKGV